MPRKRTKFKPYGRMPTRNQKDDRGTVKIQVVLVESGKRGNTPVKGNICRSVSVADARVSEVIAAIEEALIA